MATNHLKTDVLIIGAGLAGLALALKLGKRLPHKRIVLVNKHSGNESNSRHAQGGISIMVDRLHDSFAKHISDTLKSGDGQCDPKVVDMVVKEGPEQLKQLLDWGVEFQKNEDGKFDLHREGGHTANRILHAHDFTGLAIIETLTAQVKALPNITWLNHHFTTNLLIHPEKMNKCVGVELLNTQGCFVRILANATAVCTGGAGQVFQVTTNPAIATGDGMAMAHRAGAEVSHMEFVQFHPTALFAPSLNPTFLITEALRGQGAMVRNENGERFLFNTDVRGELASRDIISLAIHKELRVKKQPNVFLDATHLTQEEFRHSFPTIWNRLLEININPAKQWIPIVPAAHYNCGGIKVNSNAQTSIEQLYAIGECAYTGLHGANRLASNSLLEAIVFAERCFHHVITHIESFSTPSNAISLSPSRTHPKGVSSEGQSFKQRLKQIMTKNRGVLCSNESLKTAELALAHLVNEVEECLSFHNSSTSLWETLNMVQVSQLIVHHSLKRESNAGCFQNMDLLIAVDDGWIKN